MKLSGKFDFLGAIANQSSKEGSKPYYVVSLLQEVDVTKVYVDYDTYLKIKDIPKLTPVDVDLDITVTKDRTYISLLAVSNSKQSKTA